LKFLLDENISRKIIPLIQNESMEFCHVLSISTGMTPPISDHGIWKFARENNHHIITKDEDFIKLSMIFGPPPKVILLSIGNLKNKDLAEVIKRNTTNIQKFVDQAYYGFLILKNNDRGANGN
jgi:predicted nuclease of predicted toxin-antitoxin system